MADTRTYEALYYPFIHFRDETWVKGMSLFWDGFGRIVPSRHPTSDGDDIRRLQEAGVVRNVYPDNSRWAARDIFREILLTHRDEIVEQFAVHRKLGWPVDPVTATWAPGGDRRLAYVHVDKVNRSLADLLLDLGLAEMSRGDDSRWIGMHPRIADTYMVILAEIVARHEAARPLTDDVTAHCVAATGGPIDADRLATGLLGTAPRSAPAMSPDAEDVLVAVAFDSLLPDFNNVPVSEVLKVRSESVEARGRFQDAVAALVDREVYAGASREAMEREMRRIYEKRIVPALAELESANKRFNINVVKNTLSVKTELTGLAALASASFTQGLAAWVFGGLAVAFGVHDIAVAARDERAMVHAGQPLASYLSTLRGRIKPREVVSKAVS